MSLSDALAHYGWQLTVWLAVGGLSVIAAFAVGLTIGRRIGHHETPSHWRAVAEKWKRHYIAGVTRWHERWRGERDRRERAEDHVNELKGAQKAYDDALRRIA